MDHFFRGCHVLEGALNRRHRGFLRSYYSSAAHREELNEIEWRSHQFDWEASVLGDEQNFQFQDLVALLDRYSFVWMVPGQVFLARTGVKSLGPYSLASTPLYGTDLSADNAGFPHVMSITVKKDDSWPHNYEEEQTFGLSVHCRSRADPAVALKRIMDLLIRQPCHRVCLKAVSEGPTRDFPTSAATLSWFLEGMNENCEAIEFVGCRFSQDHCQSLARFRGTLCYLFSDLADAGRSICDAVGRDLGPTGLEPGGGRGRAELLISALRRSKSLKHLYFSELMNPEDDRLICAIGENYGLVSLTFGGGLSAEHWSKLFESVKNHPTMTGLTFNYVVVDSELGDEESMRKGRVARAHGLVELLHSNPNLLEVQFRGPHTELVDEEIMEKEVKPILQSRLCQVRAAALMDAEVDNESLRDRLVARALSGRDMIENPSLMFIMVSTFHEFVAQAYQSTRQARESGSVAGRTGRKRQRVL